MPVYVFNIAGEERTVQSGWKIRKPANAIHVLTADFVYGPDETLPVRRAPVVLTRDGDLFFAGIIDACPRSGEADETILGNVTLSISAKDPNVLADKVVIYGDRPAEPLGDRLLWVSTFFNDAGVTLDPAQDAGPILDARSYNNESGTSVLGEFTNITTWPWRISYMRLLRMAPASTASAPFNLIENDGVIPQVEGKLVITPTGDGFANRVVVPFNGSTFVTDEFTAADGQNQFPLSAVHATNAGLLTVNGIPDVPFGSDYSIVQLSGLSLSARFARVFGNWTNWNSFLPPYDGSTVPVWNEAVATWGSPGNWNAQRTEIYTPSGWALQTASGQAGGTTFGVSYTSAFKGVKVANNLDSQAAVGIFTLVLPAPDGTDADGAQVLADSAVATASQDLNLAAYTTREDGVEPGMTQHITSAKMRTDADYVVTQVDVRDVLFNQTYYDIKLAEGVDYQAATGTKQKFQSWFSSAPSTAAAVAVIRATGGAPATRTNYDVAGAGEQAVTSDGTTFVPACAKRFRSPVSGPGQMFLHVKSNIDGGTVETQLFDRTANASVGDSPVVTVVDSNEWYPVGFTVQLIQGNVYELRARPGVADQFVFVTGYVEVVA